MGDFIQKEDRWNRSIRKKLREAHIKYLKPYTDNKENEILEIIRNYEIKGTEGISHKQLAYLADLNRKSLRRYTQSLLKKGLIKRKSIHENYFLTEAAYKDPLLNASRFGNEFRLNLLDNDNLILCDDEIIDPERNKYIDYKTFTKYYEPKFLENDLIEHISFEFSNKIGIEHVLFEFSNKIGAFISYVLIQAMNPINNNSLSRKGQREFANKWVNNSIAEILPYLVRHFKKSVQAAMSKTYPSQNHDKDSEYNEKGKEVLLEKNMIDKLLIAFEKLYPGLNYELEKIINELPQISEIYKTRMHHREELKKQQKICEHTYKEPTMTLLGYYGKQCSKCQYIKRVKEPIYLTTDYRVLSKILSDNGFKQYHEDEENIYFKNDKGKKVVLPRENKIAGLTTHYIVKQSGIDDAKFRAELDVLNNKATTKKIAK